MFRLTPREMIIAVAALLLVGIGVTVRQFREKAAARVAAEPRLSP